jgi:protein-S-isoprenylcysteine O-methyltransferase Ste14
VPDLLQVVLGVEVVFFFGLRVWAEPRGRARASMTEMERGLFVEVMRGCAILQIAALVVAVGWPHWLDFATIDIGFYARVVGAGLGLCGLGILVWTHRSLGANYHSVLHLREVHELVTRGPYGRVRHPMYTALFIVFLGFSLLSANLVVAGACLGGFAVIVVRRLPREEAMLLERFGSAYEDYMQRTGRFLP